MDRASLRIHSRQQALAVRELAPQVELVLAPQLALMGGPTFVKEMIEGLEPPPWVDCLDQRGPVMALIRVRVPRVLFSGPPEVRKKLVDMGASVGVVVAEAPAQRVFELAFNEVAERVLRVRLDAAGWRA